jgi:DNA-binding transcriptional ArsR family regulator
MLEPSPIQDRPLPRKVLEILASREDEPTKSELAEAVYNRPCDSSTRALITRLTATLVDAGLIDERVVGRERRVRLTALGRARLTLKPARVGTWLDVDAAPELPEAQPADRPRFHLRHAALLAFANVRQRTGAPRQREADDHFQQLLWSIIREDSPPADDLQRFYQLARSWPTSDPRLLLGECIVRFQNETTRGAILEDLIVVGDNLQPDADAVLWATLAIIVAHHHITDPRVPSDSVAARGLLERALRLMRQAVANASLGVAAAYRIALAGSVRDGTWSYEVPPVQAPGASVDPIAVQIALSDEEVRHSAKANAILEPIEHLWARTIGPWLIRTLPTSEAIFRRVRHRDASRELRDWKQMTGGNLVVLLRGIGKSDEKLHQITLHFVEKATQMVREGSRAASALIPNINQGALLLDRDDLRLAQDDPTPDYQSLVLNNLWTPEMVAADLPPTARGV